MRLALSKSVIFIVLLLVLTASGIEKEQTCFELRDRAIKRVIIDAEWANLSRGSEHPEWIKAFYEDNPDRKFYLCRRIIIGFSNDESVSEFFKTQSDENTVETPSGRAKKSGELFRNVLIFEASDPISALKIAEDLSRTDGIEISHPVVRSALIRHWSYSPRPNDRYYQQQWNLENRDSGGSKRGIDLNVRSAWAVTGGDGIVVAFSDGGIDLDHPELVRSSFAPLHFNFETLQTNGMPSSIYETHGTHVAGILAATKNNRIGMAGIAPKSSFASWVVFGASGYPVSNERLAQMFTYGSNIVSIQTHPWGYSGVYLEGPTTVEQIAISNAVKFGRNGKGVVMVRSGGNDRQNGGNTTYNGYSNDPFVITVGAVRTDGRAASYSNPGDSILVCAPGGDMAYGFPGIFTTDIHGPAGASAGNGDLADYLYDQIAFSGSSAAAPQIAGIAALLLSVNPNLTYRDVQQILIISSKNYDLKDPFLSTNGAGLRVSFNTGFGIPDAGYAVRLSAMWSNRPPLQIITVSNSSAVPIPEDGLKLLVMGSDVPSELTNIAALPNGFGPRFDEPSRIASLVYIPDPLQPTSSNLTGKAVLLPRIGNFFDESVSNVAAAGALFAIFINNNTNNPDERVVVNVSDYSPIPSACISWRHGTALVNLLTNNAAVSAQLKPSRATLFFNVSQKLLCEHVGLFLKTDHQKRGQLRIALKSPMGTISILQRTNYDHTPNLSGWTYYSTRFFYEQSAGIWQLFVSDEMSGTTGNIVAASLSIYGVSIMDTNLNALDDRWEAAYGLSGSRASDDPDKDGIPNSIEQILNANPLLPDPINVDISVFDSNFVRLSWNGSGGLHYRVYSRTNLGQPWSILANVNGNFPETEMILQITNRTSEFFKVELFEP